MKVKKLLGLLLVILVGIISGCSSGEVDELIRYKVTVITEGNGTVQKNPDRTSFIKKDKVTLTADPAEGWVFDTWDGSVKGNTNPVTITVNEDMIIRAIFSDKNATFPLQLSVAGGGTIVVDPARNFYPKGAEVMLTAKPIVGWGFSHWEGDMTGNKNPITITMDKPKSVMAVFSCDVSEIEFEDLNLKEAVRLAIRKPVGPITPADVVNLSSLDASVTEIRSLKGIEYLVSLTNLNLASTGISDISYLAGLSNLRVLNLSGNTITNINALTGLVNLEELYLNGNQITNINSLVWLWYKHVKTLDLGGNKINDITALAGFDGLLKLVLANNAIDKLEPLANLTSLVELDLSCNLITRFSALGKMKDLQKLDLHRNMLTGIGDFVWLWDGNLRILDLSENKITEINHLYGLPKLEKVKLQNNKITQVAVFSTLPLVTELDISNNQVEDISNLKFLLDLKYLYLHNNLITDISILTDLANLREVSLMTNPNLNLTKGSPADLVVESLKQRGVVVLY